MYRIVASANQSIFAGSQHFDGSFLNVAMQSPAKSKFPAEFKLILAFRHCICLPRSPAKVPWYKISEEGSPRIAASRELLLHERKRPNANNV